MARSNAVVGLERLTFVSWQFCILVLSFLVLYGQLYWKLAAGPWRTEQEGHGPFLLAGAIVIAYLQYKQHQERLRGARGQILLAIVSGSLGAICAVVGISQDVTMIAAGSQVLLLASILLAFFGFAGLRIMVIPLLLVAAATPPPGYLVDAITVHLKERISDAVVWLLYHAGFDIAQNGVIIQAGPYELLVKDACAGMNSIFALSALSIIYVYIRSEMALWQKFALVILSLPIAIVANFLRVLTLCLITFEYGLGGEQGSHDITGILLFVVAGLLLSLTDTCLTVAHRVGAKIFSSTRPHSGAAVQSRG